MSINLKIIKRNLSIKLTKPQVCHSQDHIIPVDNLSVNNSPKLHA